MTARDSYRFGCGWEPGASVAAKPVTVPEDSRSPLVRKENAFPQRRPDWKNFICQATGYRLGRSVEIIVHREKAVGFELTKNSSQLLLDPIYGVKKIAAVHLESLATQFPVGAKEKVIPEDTIFELC